MTEITQWAWRRVSSSKILLSDANTLSFKLVYLSLRVCNGDKPLVIPKHKLRKKTWGKWREQVENLHSLLNRSCCFQQWRNWCIFYGFWGLSFDLVLVRWPFLHKCFQYRESDMWDWTWHINWWNISTCFIIHPLFSSSSFFPVWLPLAQKYWLELASFDL